MAKRKITVKPNVTFQKKTTIIQPHNSAREKCVWLFDRVDRDGPFAFDLKSSEFDHKDFLGKMVEYAQLTWAEIANQRHDKSKSKHHYLGFNSLSDAAQKRFFQVCSAEETDIVFSFALNNLLRIIGIKEDKFFHVLWYDAKHGVCPSTKK